MTIRFTAIFLFTLAGSAAADYLKHFGPIEAENKRCYNNGCSEDAWTVNSLPGIRIVAFSHEDGFSYSFNEVKNDKQMSVLFRFIPYIHGLPGEPGEYMPSASELKQLPLSRLKGKICLDATFNRPIEADGHDPYPVWQKQIPIIRFNSARANTQEQATVSFHCMTLTELMQQVRATPPPPPKPAQEH